MNSQHADIISKKNPFLWFYTLLFENRIFEKHNDNHP